MSKPVVFHWFKRVDSASYFFAGIWREWGHCLLRNISTGGRRRIKKLDNVDQSKSVTDDDRSHLFRPLQGEGHRVKCQTSELGAGLEVPEAQRLIGGSRQRAPPVRQHRHAVDPPLMPLEATRLPGEDRDTVRGHGLRDRLDEHRQGSIVAPCSSR
jgi:hypothetical protein